MPTTAPQATFDATNAGGCCDDSNVYIEECYTYPKTCVQINNWAASCGCCGETYIQANLSGINKPLGSCSTVTVKDPTATLAAGAPKTKFALLLKFGCESHTINFCNLPAAPTDWNAFIYTVLATDGVLLQNNIKITILSASPTKKELVLKVCAECPNLSIAVGNPIVGTVTVTTEAVALIDTAPKLGQFVAYAYDGGALSGIQTYDDKLNYAGLLNLPKGLKQDACCLPSYVIVMQFRAVRQSSGRAKHRLV